MKMCVKMLVPVRAERQLPLSFVRIEDKSKVVKRSRDSQRNVIGFSVSLIEMR